MKVKTVSEDTKTKSNPLEDLNSDEKQNQVISFEPKNSTQEFDPKFNRFECVSCGFIYDPDGITGYPLGGWPTMVVIDREMILRYGIYGWSEQAMRTSIEGWL